MPGDDSWGIGRNHAHKLTRFEVYSKANTHARLRGIAIAPRHKIAGMMAGMQAPLSR